MLEKTQLRRDNHNNTINHLPDAQRVGHLFVELDGESLDLRDEPPQAVVEGRALAHQAGTQHHAPDCRHHDQID